MTDDGIFDDLLAANKRYARSAPREFDGIAHQGVMILTCMDSRIEPLEMVGLMIGEAKILRTAGARLTDRGLGAFIMGAVWLWFAIRCAVGLIYLSQGEAYPRPQTWLI